MNTAVGLDWIREMLWVGLLASAPLVLTITTIGLLFAVLQAATQINEAALPFAAKTVGVFVVLTTGGAWMLGEIREFTVAAIEAIARVTGS